MFVAGDVEVLVKGLVQVHHGEDEEGPVPNVARPCRVPIRGPTELRLAPSEVRVNEDEELDEVVQPSRHAYMPEEVNWDVPISRAKVLLAWIAESWYISVLTYSQYASHKT